MTDTDRTLPDVIDATTLPPDEAERRRLRAVETAKGCTDAVAVTLRYQLAQADKRTARERYNAAGPALDLASIRERLEEVECQAEILQSEGVARGDTTRDAIRRACLCVAFYVVAGRVPEKKGA